MGDENIDDWWWKINTHKRKKDKIMDWYEINQDVTEYDPRHKKK